MKRLDPTDYHVPVMAHECLRYLNVRSNGTYCDGTLGGGGHTALILAQLAEGGRLFSFDADEVAIHHCEQRFRVKTGDRTMQPILNHTNFEHMAGVMRDEGPVDGILLDLGVSSYQFDHHERGFSYRADAPLDMRFTATGITAADILNERSEQEIAKIFYDFGEDPSSRRIAAAIVNRRNLAPFHTTLDLRNVVVTVVPPQHQSRSMSRIFQALRIAVNNELSRLEATLESMIPLLAPDGRVVVMSYHSLEDRIVKDVFRKHSGMLTLLTKKAIEPQPQEVETNPRSRSAKLRAAARLL